MTKKTVNPFYTKKKWIKTRNSVLFQKKGICEKCFRILGKGEYQVHHKKRLELCNEEEKYDFDNLELLCLDCHNKEHSRFTKINSRVNFNEKGEIVF